MTPSDDELMAGIREHDAEAFEALAARYRERLRRHLTGITHETDSAEDLLQETLLRVWTRADQWDGRGAVKAWLFRIATNLALNHLRGQKRRRERSLEPPVDAWDDGDDLPSLPACLIDAIALGPEQQIQRAERDERLRQLVDTLPDAKRDVFRLVHEEEWELRDVARQLDIPEGTVKSRLYHARKHLAQQWNAWNDEGEER